MKIVFAGIVICGAEGIDSPKDFSFNGQRKMQISETLRGTQITPRDRLNRQTQIEFTVTRSHGTVQVAEAFAITHEDSLPGSGQLQLIADDGTHTAQIKRSLNPAVLNQCKVKYNGQLSTTSYNFTGGAITTN